MPAPHAEPTTSASNQIVPDGRDGQYHVTWTRLHSTLLLHSTAAKVTIARGSRQLTLHGETGHGFVRGRDVGAPIHMTDAGPDGSDLTTRITHVLDARTVLLADQATTELTQTPVRLTWPCFLSEDTGKGIRIEGAVAVNPRNDQTPPRYERQFYLNFGAWLTLQTRIVTVTSPVSVTLELPITAPDATCEVRRVSWGTDNSAAIVGAGLDAIAAGQEMLRFPPGLTCAWAITQHRNVGTIIGQLRWTGEGARTIVTDHDANELFVQPSDPLRRTFAAPPRGVIARTQMPRMSRAHTVTVAICGDSMSVFDLWGSAASSPAATIIREMETQNPGKSFVWHDLSIGGATWNWLDQHPGIFPSWYTDRTRPWLAYVEDVTPDVVIAAIGGGNDGAVISLAALESVLAKIRAMPPDSLGNPPDLVLMNCRPEGRWRQPQIPGPDADEVTDRWFWQVQREIPNQLHRSYAARHGIAFLDYEDVAQRALWGWSYQRATLRRVPDCEPQICTPTRPARFRRWCRDFSAAITLPGDDARAGWSAVGVLSIQIGGRPDNVVLARMSPRGHLAVRVNAWGRTAPSCTASIDRGNRILTTGGDVAFDGDWAIGAGSNVVIHVRDGAWLTEADVGKSILLPRAGLNGEPLRSFIAWVGTLPNQLGLTDAAISSVAGNAGELRYGGMLFMPSDARGSADIELTVGKTGLHGKIASYIGPTQVILSHDWSGETVTEGRASVFVGRVSMPWTDTSLDLAGFLGPEPALSIYVRGTQLFVGFMTSASRNQASQAFRGNVLRYGGPFEPVVTPSAPGPVRLHVRQCYVEETVIEGQVLTDYEMWGDGNPPATSPWDGNGLNHLTHMQLAIVDEPLLRVQDFAG